MEGDAAAAQPGRRLLSLESEAAVAADAVRDMGALSGLGPSEQYFMSVEFTLTYIQYVHFSSHEYKTLLFACYRDVVLHVVIVANVRVAGATLRSACVCEQ